MSRPMYNQNSQNIPKNDISTKSESSKGPSIYSEMEFLTKLNNELKTHNAELAEENEINKITIQQINTESLDWKMLYESRVALIKALRVYIEELKHEFKQEESNKQL